MATVYLADDLKHERKVALKVLKPELAEHRLPRNTDLVDWNRPHSGVRRRSGGIRLARYACGHHLGHAAESQKRLFGPERRVSLTTTKRVMGRSGGLGMNVRILALCIAALCVFVYVAEAQELEKVEGGALYLRRTPATCAANENRTSRPLAPAPEGLP